MLILVIRWSEMTDLCSRPVTCGCHGNRYHKLLSLPAPDLSTEFGDPRSRTDGVDSKRTNRRTHPNYSTMIHTVEPWVKTWYKKTTLLLRPLLVQPIQLSLYNSIKCHLDMKSNWCTPGYSLRPLSIKTTLDCFGRSPKGVFISRSNCNC